MAIPLVIRDPRLVELHAYWDDRRGGRTMPAAGDIWLLDLAFILPHLLWIEIEHDPRRYRFRRVGTELERIYGSSIEGLTVDQVPGVRLRRMAGRAFAEVVGRRAPVCRRARFSTAAWFMKYERLLLPVSSDGEGVDVVIGAVLPEFGPARA